MVLPTKSGSFGKTVSEEKIIKKSTYLKTELPVTDMFANGSGRNGQFLKRTFPGYFLPNVGSFVKAVSEEKIF